MDRLIANVKWERGVFYMSNKGVGYDGVYIGNGSESDINLSSLLNRLIKRRDVYLKRGRASKSLNDKIQQNAKATSLAQVIHDIQVMRGLE